MTNFICTVEHMNQMLSIVNSIPLPTTKLEVFNNGIKFDFDINLKEVGRQNYRNSIYFDILDFELNC